MMKLYIDPGTGSMLFAALIGIIGTLRYLIKLGIAKAKYRTSGKKDATLEVIPFVIYSDNKRYWNVFEPIIKELDSRGFDIRYFTQSIDDKALVAKYKHLKAEFIGEGNKGFSKMNYLKAVIVLSTTPSLGVYQWKKTKDVKYYLHIFHAATEAAAYRMFGIDDYDGVFTSGEHQIKDIRELERLRKQSPKDTIMVGIPYFDEMKNKLKTSIVNRNKTTVLLAPSWGPNAILSKYGEKLVKELIDTGYKIIIRPHPQSYLTENSTIMNLMNKYPDIEWNQDVDNFDVLNRSDIMISDFSGVIFDFSLVFDKPIIYADTHFDNSVYDIWWLNHPLYTFTILEKLGEKLDESNINKLKSVIDNCLTNHKYQEGRDQVRKETWANQGKGASLAADFIIKKYIELTKGGDN